MNSSGKLAQTKASCLVVGIQVTQTRENLPNPLGRGIAPSLTVDIGQPRTEISIDPFRHPTPSLSHRLGPAGPMALLGPANQCPPAYASHLKPVASASPVGRIPTLKLHGRTFPQ